MTDKNMRSAGTSGTSPDGGKTLLDAAVATTRLNEFERATKSAGMADLLSGKGPFTVFAPTDKAFAKLSESERDALFADAKALARMLRYHIVRARVKAPRDGAPNRVTTLQGGELEVTRDGAGYRVNSARIVKTRIRATNGVIHAIDTVLVPGQ